MVPGSRRIQPREVGSRTQGRFYEGVERDFTRTVKGGFGFQSFPGGSDGKASACNVGDPGSIPRLGRSPGEGNGNPLQYPCLENPTDRGTWQATVHGVAKSRTRLSDFTLSVQKIQDTRIQSLSWDCERLV